MIFVMYFVSLSACVFELVLVKQMQRNASESKAQRRRRTVPATALADLDESTCIRNTMKYMYWRILFEMCWPPVVYVVKCCCETCLHAMCLLSHLQKERVLRRSSQIPFRNNWNGNWGFLAILICHHSVCVCACARQHQCQHHKETPLFTARHAAKSGSKLPHLICAAFQLTAKNQTNIK